MADKLKTATRTATCCAKRRRGQNRDALLIEKPHKPVCCANGVPERTAQRWARRSVCCNLRSTCEDREHTRSRLAESDGTGLMGVVELYFLGGNSETP